MPSDPVQLTGHFVPDDPGIPQGDQFLAQVTSLLDGKTKSDAEVTAALSGWEEQFELIAAELYRTASMLVGEGEETIRLIERVVTHADISSSLSHIEARHNGRLRLASDAIAILHQRDAAAFAAPDIDDAGPVSCIEDDDLSAAGVTSAELEAMLTGPDNHRLRTWLEGLPVSLRTVFVLRAVANLNSPEVAGLLAENGGPVAVNWTPDAVRASFRQALCSLTSQLLHASASR